jgi:subtilisin family serine protease
MGVLITASLLTCVQVVLAVSSFGESGRKHDGSSTSQTPITEVNESIVTKPVSLPNQAVVRLKQSTLQPLAKYSIGTQEDMLAKSLKNLFNDDSIIVDIETVRQGSGGSDFSALSNTAFQFATVESTAVATDELLEKLNQTSYVEFAEPNIIFYPVEDSATHWNIFTNEQQAGIEANAAWERGYTGQGVTVAVIDTGFDLDHPDLAGVFWQNSGETSCSNGVDDDSNGFIDDCFGWDFGDKDNDPNPDPGLFHGTHVTGIIAARQNGEGVVGVAPDVSIMALKGFRGLGASLSDTLSAIDYAVNNGAQVITMSLGGNVPCNEDSSIAKAIENAVNAGVFVVVASGNTGPGPVTPASCQFSFTVGATDNTRTLAGFSSYWQDMVDVVAPGSEIKSTSIDEYANLSGTSMAAPHVSGLAALVLQGSSKSPTELKELFCDTAIDLGETGKDSKHGCGMINTASVMESLYGPISPDIDPVISPQTQTVEIGDTVAPIVFDGIPNPQFELLPGTTGIAIENCDETAKQCRFTSPTAAGIAQFRIVSGQVSLGASISVSEPEPDDGGEDPVRGEVGISPVEQDIMVDDEVEPIQYQNIINPEVDLQPGETGIELITCDAMTSTCRFTSPTAAGVAEFYVRIEGVELQAIIRVTAGSIFDDDDPSDGGGTGGDDPDDDGGGSDDDDDPNQDDNNPGGGNDDDPNPGEDDDPASGDNPDDDNPGGDNPTNPDEQPQDLDQNTPPQVRFGGIDISPRVQMLPVGCEPKPLVGGGGEHYSFLLVPRQTGITKEYCPADTVGRCDLSAPEKAGLATIIVFDTKGGGINVAGIVARPKPAGIRTLFQCARGCLASDSFMQCVSDCLQVTSTGDVQCPFSAEETAYEPFRPAPPRPPFITDDMRTEAETKYAAAAVPSSIKNPEDQVEYEMKEITSLFGKVSTCEHDLFDGETDYEKIQERYVYRGNNDAAWQRALISTPAQAITLQENTPVTVSGTAKSNQEVQVYVFIPAENNLPGYKTCFKTTADISGSFKQQFSPSLLWHQANKKVVFDAYFKRDEDWKTLLPSEKASAAPFDRKEILVQHEYAAQGCQTLCPTGVFEATTIFPEAADEHIRRANFHSIENSKVTIGRYPGEHTFSAKSDNKDARFSDLLKITHKALLIETLKRNLLGEKNAFGVYPGLPRITEQAFASALSGKIPGSEQTVLLIEQLKIALESTGEKRKKAVLRIAERLQPINEKMRPPLPIARLLHEVLPENSRNWSHDLILTFQLYTGGDYENSCLMANDRETAQNFVPYLYGPINFCDMTIVSGLEYR